MRTLIARTAAVLLVVGAAACQSEGPTGPRLRPSSLPLMHQAGPCAPSDDPGHSEFARHHVVPLAQAGELGAGGHTPGAHRGYSACNPSGR
jgi:hypothetical protein